MKTIKPIFLVLAVFILSLNSCKKENKTSPDTNASSVNTNRIDIVKDSSLSNHPLELQAIQSNSGFKTFCYGNFKNDGTPDTIKEIIINKIAGDTSLNLFFDNQMRVKMLFQTINNIKQNSILTLDYETQGKIILKKFYFDFSSDSMKLEETFTIDSVDVNHYTLNNYSVYKTQDWTQNFINTFGSAQGAIAALNVVIVAATTTGGCLLGGPAGCALGFGLGSYIISQPANASEIGVINSPQNNSPTSPSVQTTNTQLNISKIFSGLNISSGSVPFGGTPYCNYSVEYTNTALEIKLNPQNNVITKANISTTMHETVLTANCYAGNNNWVKKNYHTLLSGQISGNNVSISFLNNQNNFPNNITTFVGTKYGNQISGTIKLIRNNNDMSCTVNIPIIVNVIK